MLEQLSYVFKFYAHQVVGFSDLLQRSRDGDYSIVSVSFGDIDLSPTLQIKSKHTSMGLGAQ